MKTILASAIKLHLEDCPVAWDILEDAGITDDKLWFTWDYVITKDPVKYTNGYCWQFLHQADYFRAPFIVKNVIDIPVKNVFLLDTGDSEAKNGWGENLWCYYVDNSFVVCCSHDYSSKVEAYVELIYNWYTFGCY